MFEMLATFYSLLERLPRKIGISVRFFPRRRSSLSPPSPFLSVMAMSILLHLSSCLSCLLIFTGAWNSYDAHLLSFCCFSQIDLDLGFLFLTVIILTKIYLMLSSQNYIYLVLCWVSSSIKSSNFEIIIDIIHLYYLGILEILADYHLHYCSSYCSFNPFSKINIPEFFERTVSHPDRHRAGSAFIAAGSRYTNDNLKLGRSPRTMLNVESACASTRIYARPRV